MDRRVTRRSILAAAGAAALAGCVGAGGGDDALHLDSVDVGGSPGSEVRVAPPGTPLLLDFFATWCAPCEPQMENLRAVRDAFDPDRLAMRSITSERDEGAIREFWERNDGTWPVLVDPDLEAANRYDAHRVPTLLVLTPDGSESWRHVGLAGEDRLRAEVREVVE